MFARLPYIYRALQHVLLEKRAESVTRYIQALFDAIDEIYKNDRTERIEGNERIDGSERIDQDCSNGTLYVGHECDATKQ